MDVGSGKMVAWQQEGFFPGEPIFLPRPGSTAEDDGVLLSIVLQGGGAIRVWVVLGALGLVPLGLLALAGPS